MATRREFLAATGTAAVAGCLGGGPGSKARVQFTTEEPLFTAESQWSSAPFTAAVFETPSNAAAINDEVSHTDGIEQYLQFDPNEEFLAVFASTLRLAGEGRNKGWCPRRSVDGDRFLFRIPLDEWPEPLEESANWAMLNVWRLPSFGNPPSRASVSVEFPPDDVRTCSD